MCVCVCHVTVAPNLLAQHVKGSALCFRPVAPGHSGSGSQGELRNGSSVTVWSWLRHWHWQRGRRSHPQDRCQGRGQASRFLSPRMVSHDPTTPLGSLYPGPGVSGRCTQLTRGCADARAGMFWDTSAWSAHSWKSVRRSVPTNSPEPGGTHSSAKGVYTRLSWTQAAPRPWSNKPWLSQGLLEEGWVENRCVHGDIYKYPIASLRLPLVIHSMGFFPLEQFRDDTLRPAFAKTAPVQKLWRRCCFRSSLKSPSWKRCWPTKACHSCVAP